jgi:diaminopimelate decarboxylase
MAGLIKYIDGRLFFASKDVAALVNLYGTPQYFYHLPAIRSQYDQLSFLWKKAAPANINAGVCYAVKANPLREILSVFTPEETLLSADTYAHVLTAIESGFPPVNIQYFPVNFEYPLIKELVSTGVCLVIDDPRQLELLKPFAPLDISIRVCPFLETELSHDAGYQKGILFENVETVLKQALSSGLQPAGLHQHIGAVTYSYSMELVQNGITALCKLFKKLVAAGYPLYSLSLGGGMGGRNASKLDDFPIESFINKTWECIESLKVPVSEVIIEPGRYLVSNAAILVGKVKAVHPSEEGDRVITNFSSGDLNLNYLEFNEVPIYAMREIKNGGKRKAIITNDDSAVGKKFEWKVIIPELVPGDILVIYPAGAYNEPRTENNSLAKSSKNIFALSSRQFIAV